MAVTLATQPIPVAYQMAQENDVEAPATADKGLRMAVSFEKDRPAAGGGSSTFTKANLDRNLSRLKSSVALLRDVDQDKQLTVEFTNVNAWVPVLFSTGPDNGKAAPKERQVLHNVSATIAPGEVLALMGPSGSGKSTLLAVVGGRSMCRTEGSITVGGQKVTKLIKRKLGYVTQDDLLFAELTVWETLYFAAMLRLPRSMAKADKINRVSLVLESLGLQKCKDTIIGGGFMRGVSGGERKRVSIGHELLINPSVLFLDEPTSGLDSTTALKLLHTLRSLASGGRTVITSIHQPSSRLYLQMDKLLLLSEGHTMYYGNAHLAVDWFNKLGQTLPYGVNIADHILDLACGDLPGLEPEESQQICKNLIEAFAVCKLDKDGVQTSTINTMVSAASAKVSSRNNSIQLDGLAPAEALAARRTSQQLQVDMFAEEEPSKPAEAHSSVVTMNLNGAKGPEEVEEGKWGATWLQQVHILTIRSIKTRRLSALSWQKFAQVLVVAVLAGLFWWQSGQETPLTPTVVRDVGGLLFFIQLFMSFSALFAALFTFPAEFGMLVKERQSGMYRLSAYYVARTLSDLPMDCLIPTLFLWVLYWMCGLRINAGAFFCMWWTVLLVLMVSQSVGLFIGATVQNPQNGQTIATILMLTFMLVGGYYVADIPVWIAWLKYASFIYWGWNLQLKIQYRHYPVDCSEVPMDSPAYNGTQCDVQDMGEFEINVNENVYPEVLVLLGMLAVGRLAVYIALRWKTSFKHIG